MISLVPKSNVGKLPLSRRDLLKLGGIAAIGSSVIPADISFGSGAPATATAKNCIFIFLCGGPSQLEMWDPKPDAPEEIRGPFGTIDTNVPGIRIGKLLPTVSKHVDKLANHGSDKPVCGGFNKGVDMLTAPYCCLAFDRVFSALLEDLSQRGLLDETLMVVAGEFGRTPKMNKNAGRDHWASCYSTVLAGGGVQGGQVYGASDSQAAYVKDSPVRPEDLGATVLHAFGVSPETPIYDAARRPVRASKGQPVTSLFV